jgi:CRISPR-associated exonuclease Cas4
MLLCEIPEAFLFYGETKRRLKVVLDHELRGTVKTIFEEMHELYDRRHTPKVKLFKSCKACSLADICMPRLCKNLSAEDYIKKNILEVDE